MEATTQLVEIAAQAFGKENDISGVDDEVGAESGPALLVIKAVAGVDCVNAGAE